MKFTLHMEGEYQSASGETLASWSVHEKKPWLSEPMFVWQVDLPSHPNAPLFGMQPTLASAALEAQFTADGLVEWGKRIDKAVAGQETS